MNWDLFVILLVIWNAIYIPLDVAYGLNLLYINLLNYCIDLIFLADLLLNFVTMTWDSKTDELVWNRCKIAFKYVFKGRFAIDILSIIPFEIISLVAPISPKNLKFIKLLKMVRMLRLTRIINYLRANRNIKLGLKII